MLKALILSAIVFASGLGIPTMAAINGALGARLASPVFATVILLFVGLIISIVYMLIFFGMPRWPSEMPPLWSFTGGFFVVFYVLSVTAIAPVIGLGNAIFLVLLGQIMATTAIDHFGWFGALQNPVSVQKAAGLAFMIVGVILARKVG
ncbi:MAG: DMT family transporter [Paracoccaceae bacterium]